MIEETSDYTYGAGSAYCVSYRAGYGVPGHDGSGRGDNESGDGSGDGYGFAYGGSYVDGAGFGIPEELAI